MPNIKRVVVVEDEQIIAMQLNVLLGDLGYDTFTSFSTFDSVVSFLRANKVDLVIIDIQLNEQKDGIDIASYINKTCKTPFIFLTSLSNKETLERVKKVSPYAYLLKPFTKEDLYTSIELALHNHEIRKNGIEEHVFSKDSFFVKANKRYRKIYYKDVLYAQSDHIYVKLFTKDGSKYLIRSTMAELDIGLPENFIQVHRSYICNLNFISVVNSDSVEVMNELIPVSKKYNKHLLNTLNYKK